MIAYSTPVGETHRFALADRVRRWSLWSLPRCAIGYFLTVELLTLTLTSVMIAQAPLTRRNLLSLGVLAVLALAYAEAADRIDRFKRFLGHDGIWADHASVWAVTGLLVLPTGYAVVLVLLVYAQQLLSGYRHQSAHPHRAIFVTSTMVLATLVASMFLGVTGGGIGTGGPLTALATVGALALFPVVNLATLLGGKALATRTRRIGALLPDRETVAYELMTLVLGLLTASLWLHTPWLTPLTLLLLAGMHRSSLVKGLQIAASTDAKTGLLNLAAWESQANQSLSRAARENHAVAVVMIDLDYFKEFNDTHGHLAGDRALQQVAAALAVEVRGHDILGRFGGEEFVVFLEGPSAEEAAKISERLCQSIAALTTAITPGVTASVGLAHCGQTRHAKLADLLHVADTALYAAKSAGRNRVDVIHVGAPAMS